MQAEEIIRCLELLGPRNAQREVYYFRSPKPSRNKSTEAERMKGGPTENDFLPRLPRGIGSFCSRPRPGALISICPASSARRGSWIQRKLEVLSTRGHRM
jgi:hypothetical protein